MLGRPQKKVKGKPVNRLGVKTVPVPVPLMDIDEVTKALNCSRAFLLQAVNGGLIRVVQAESQAGSMLYSKPDVEAFAAWLKEAATSPTPVTTPGVPWIEQSPAEPAAK